MIETIISPDLAKQEAAALPVATPDVAPVTSEAPKPTIDPVAAAALATAAKEANEAAFAKAQADCKASAELSASAAGEIIARGRNSLADLGMIFQTHFDESCASGLIPWDNAANMLRSALSLETGESIDVGTPMQVHTAADFFGRPAFIVLPIDAQRAFGRLFALTASLDDKGQANGRKHYALTGLGNNDSIRAFAFACGRELAECSKFLPGARFAKLGYMQQEDVRTLISIFQRAATAGDKKKIVDDVSAKPEALANVAKAAIAEKEQAKLEKSVKRELVSTLLTAHAKGETVAPSSPDANGATALATDSLPPHGRAVGICSSLKESPELCGALAKTIEIEVFADIFAAMTDAGRLADLQLIHRKLAAEILIATRVAAEGGPAKCNRLQARKLLKADAGK